MKDADKPNNLGIWTNIKPGVVVDIEGEQWQVLTRLNFSSEMMNVCDGRVKVWQQEELEKQGAYVVEGAATLHDRLSQYGVIVRAQELMDAADVRRDTPIAQIEKLIDERDEWEDLVMQVREALGFPRTGYCAVVNEVRKLKELSAQEDTPFVRKVCAIFDICGPGSRQRVLDKINGLKSKATSQDKRIKEMDEALEQSLMEIAQQAGVIAELRDELKRAQNSIDDLMYDAANLNGQKEAYERALQIVGGAR